MCASVSVYGSERVRACMACECMRARVLAWYEKVSVNARVCVYEREQAAAAASWKECAPAVVGVGSFRGALVAGMRVAMRADGMLPQCV